jgi:hypothetical protein
MSEVWLAARRWRPCARVCGVDVANIFAELAAGAPMMSHPRWSRRRSAIAPESVAARGHPPRGFWIRVVAAIIDTAVILIAQAFLYAVASMVFGSRSSIAIRGAAQVFGAMLVAVYPLSLSLALGPDTRQDGRRTFAW